MFKLLIIETKKARREWVFYLIALVFVVLNVANGVSNYLSNKPVFIKQDITWLAVWGQAALLWSVIFLPFAIILYCGMLSSVDNADKNWQRLISYGIAYPTYLTKLVKAIIYCIFSQMVFLVAVVISGLALGFRFDTNTIGMLTGWAILGVIGGISISAVQLWLGLYISSYPVIAGVGIVGAFMGLTITLVLPAINLFFPYSQIVIGNHVRHLAAFSPAMVGFVCLFNAICIALPSILALAKLRSFTQ